MSAELYQADPLDELAQIPEGVHNRFGNYVELLGDEIQLHDPVKHCVLRMLQIPEGQLRYAVRLRVAHAVKNYAPTSILFEFETVAYLLRESGSPRRFEDMDIGWWNTLREKLRKESIEWKLHCLRYWFLWLDDQGFPGIDSDAVDIIEAWSIPGNVKGEAVRSRDPNSGPLTWGQYAHLISRLSNESEKGITQELAVVQLCVNLGLNSRHLALLEERDLTFQIDPETGEKDYFIDVPRIKKRLAQRETKRRHIRPETGKMLEELMAQNRSHRGRIEWEQSGKMPLFSRRTPRVFPSSSPLSRRFEWHSSSDRINELIAKFSDTHELMAGGSDERFYLTARRLRYTFATMLAATGAPPVAIAEALDHTDLQHVGVYVLATGKLADRLNQAIGRHIEPWIKRFLVGPPNAIPDGRPNVVHNPDPSKALGIGYCGLSSQCRLFPPDSCYGCDFFQPWIDADHESVLQRLETRKAALMDNRGSASDRIPHQLDAVIQSVKLVIEAQRIAKERRHD